MAGDIGVRLTAQGTEEILGQLRRVQQGAERMGHSGARAMGEMNGSLGMMHGLFENLHVIIGAIGFERMLHGAAETAQTLHLMSLRTGDNVTNLGALDTSLRQMGSDLPTASRQLQGFLLKTQDAADGVGDMRTKLIKLGLTLEEIRSLTGASFSKRIEIAAVAMARLPEGAQKAALQTELLGTRGAALIPLFDRVGKVGIGGLIQEAERLGVLMDDTVYENVLKVHDAFEEITLVTRGIGQNLAAGFGPSFQAAIAGLTQEVVAGAGGWQIFGEAVGNILGVTTIVIANFIDFVNTKFTGLAANVASAFRAAAAAAVGNFSEAQVHIEAISLRNAREEELLAERIALAWEKFRNPPEPVKGEIVGPTEDEATLAQRRASEKLQMEKTSIENRLSLLKAGYKVEERLNQSAYDNDLRSTHAYYAEKRRLAAASANAEIDALRRQRSLQEDDKGVDALKNVAKIDNQIKVLEIQRRDAVAALNDEEFRAVRDLGKQRLKIDDQIAAARGDRHAVAMAQIRDEIEAQERLLDKLNTPPREKKRVLQKLEDSLSSREEFRQTAEEAAGGLDAFARERAVIERRAADGLQTQYDAEQDILALERKRLPILRALAERMREAAAASGDPDAMARARDFSIEVENLALQLDKSSRWLERVGVVGKEALEKGIGDALSTVGDDAWVFGEKMRELAVSVAASMQRMIAQMLAAQAVAAAFKFLGAIFGKGGGDTFGVDSPAPGGPVYAATGGLIPGGPRGTDRIPAWLTEKEFVVRAPVVQRPGMLQHLREINGGVFSPRAWGGVQRFEGGGLVGPSTGSASQGTQSSLVIGLEEGLILRALDSAEADKITVRRMTRNRRGIRRVLGG